MCRRWGRALDTGDINAVLPYLVDSKTIEVTDNVWVLVSRVPDLIEQLCGYCTHRHQSASPGVFTYGEVPIRFDFRNGITRILETWYFLEEGIIAARGLLAALDDMTGGERACQ